MRFGGGAPKCEKCGKTVYLNEKLEWDGHVFHRDCFRCTMCKSAVSLNKVAMLNGDMFCKPCFKKTFAESGGKYSAFDDVKGAGKNKQKKNWGNKKKEKANGAPAPAAAGGGGGQKKLSPAEEIAAARAKAAAKNDGDQQQQKKKKQSPAEEIAAARAAAEEKAKADKAAAANERAAAAKRDQEKRNKSVAAKCDEKAKKPAAKSQQAASKPDYDGDTTSLQGAWEQLLDENSSTNWTVFGFPNGSKRLAHVASGADGVTGMTKWFDEGDACFAALKVFGVDEQEYVTSKRAKYISIQFVGKNMKGIKRMKVLQNRGTAEGVMRGCATNMEFTKVADVTPLAIAKQLLTCGGAHKPTHYDFGDMQVTLSEIFDDYM